MRTARSPLRHALRPQRAMTSEQQIHTRRTLDVAKPKRLLCGDVHAVPWSGWQGHTFRYEIREGERVAVAGGLLPPLGVALARGLGGAGAAPALHPVQRLAVNDLAQRTWQGMSERSRNPVIRTLSRQQAAGHAAAHLLGREMICVTEMPAGLIERIQARGSIPATP